MPTRLNKVTTALPANDSASRPATLTPNDVHTHDIRPGVRGSLMKVSDHLSVWKLDSTQEPITPVAEPATSMHSCHGVFTDQFIFKNREFEICQVSQASQKNLQT